MRQPIDLRTHGRGFPAFMAIQTRVWDDTLAEMFSPHVMLWSDRIRIYDLRSCRDFWQAEATKRGMTVLALFGQLLEVHFHDHADDHPPFRAATASHPWQAVLLVGLMHHRGIQGWINRTGPFGAQWAAHLPWSVWFDSVTQLHPHLERRGKKGDFRRDLDLMRRSVMRLGFRDLSGLKKVSMAAVKRRFGPVMAQVWRWTHAEDSSAIARGYGDFPWLGWTPQTVPTVVRHLDYPHWRFEQLEPLLIHDLDVLCRHDAWSPRQRLVELSWRVVLEDLEELPVCVAFRHPHPLHGEMGHHKTALMRIKTRYFDEIAHWAQRRSDEPLVQEWPVVSWTLTVARCFTYAERNLELFEEFRAHRANRDQIRALENQLAIPLMRYATCRDFQPEDAFIPRDASKTGLETQSHDLQWRLGVRYRPLFFYGKPKPIEEDGMHRRFLERVQVKWWQGPPREAVGSGRFSRDYFRARDAQHRYHWVYRDHTGRWFAHGIYS